MKLDKTRRGKFWISGQLIMERPEDYRVVMSDVLIVRAEMHHARDAIEYDGFCDAFDELAEGDELPFYEAQITKTCVDTLAGIIETTHKWVRVK